MVQGREQCHYELAGVNQCVLSGLTVGVARGAVSKLMECGNVAHKTIPLHLRIIAVLVDRLEDRYFQNPLIFKQSQSISTGALCFSTNHLWVFFNLSSTL